jgi:MFS family permease
VQQAKLGALQRIGPYWIAGWFYQSVWQVLFCMNTPLSLLASAAVLLGATRSFHTALDGVQEVLQRSEMFSVRLCFLLSASTAINAAWVAVATAIACCVAVTTNTRLAVLPWAVAMAAVVALNGVRVTRTKKNLMYIVTLAWSFAGVYAAQAPKYAAMKTVTQLALASMVACAAWILVTGGKGTEGTGDAGQVSPQGA